MMPTPTSLRDLEAVPPATPKRPTVLLIDDEAPARQLVGRILMPECRILEVANAEAGLRILERGDPPIDLVITDLLMPGLDGLDVLAVLREHRPELPLLVISAFAGTIYPVLDWGEHFRILQKPFSAGALRDAVTLLVGRARHTRPASAKHHSLDLVAAAWAMHREREADRRS